MPIDVLREFNTQRVECLELDNLMKRRMQRLFLPIVPAVRA